MRSVIYIALSALAALAAADNGNPFRIPNGGYSFQAGSATTLNWDPTSHGTVTLKLQWGSVSTPKDGITIASSIPNSGSFTWTPPSDLVAKPDYTIEIIDDSEPGNYNFLPPFAIAGATGVATDVTATATATNTASTGTASTDSAVSTTFTTTTSASSSTASSTDSSSTASSTDSSSTESTSTSSPSSSDASTTSAAASTTSAAASTTSAAAATTTSAESTKTTAVPNINGASATRMSVGMMAVALGAFALM